jgi:hypothetical protein
MNENEKLHLNLDRPQNNPESLDIKKKKRRSMRKYFLPVQASKNEKIRALAKNTKGMFIIKWKKGLESLNIIEKSSDEEEQDDQDESDETKETPKIVITKALRK